MQSVWRGLSRPALFGFNVTVLRRLIIFSGETCATMIGYQWAKMIIIIKSHVNAVVINLLILSFCQTCSLSRKNEKENGMFPMAQLQSLTFSVTVTLTKAEVGQDMGEGGGGGFSYSCLPQWDNITSRKN